MSEIYYDGDESHVCSQGHMPYAWQFPNEEVSICSEKGFHLNIFGFISRDNPCFWQSSEKNIKVHFVRQVIDDRLLQINKTTSIVLENASIHKAKMIET